MTERNQSESDPNSKSNDSTDTPRDNSLTNSPTADDSVSLPSYDQDSIDKSTNSQDFKLRINKNSQSNDDPHNSSDENSTESNDVIKRINSQTNVQTDPKFESGSDESTDVQPNINSKTISYEYKLDPKFRDFKELFKEDEFNLFILNFENYENYGTENGFRLFKKLNRRNRFRKTIIKTPIKPPRSKGVPRVSSQPTTLDSSDKNSISSSSMSTGTNRKSSGLSEMRDMFLSHFYKKTPGSFNHQFFYQQVTCYMKNQNDSLAYFQGFSLTDLKGRFFPIALTGRPVNGPLSSLFSTVKINQTKKLTKNKIHRSDFININDLTAVTAEQKFKIIIGIIHGIAFIHKNNFVHSNLNPTTVYLNEKLQPIICDYIFIPPFKITTIKNDSDDDDDEEYRFKYSIDPEEPTIEFENKKYVAPEIIEGKEFSREVDIYSLGYIIEYILREKEEDDDDEGEKNTKTEDNKIGEKWNKLINKCIKREPKERPTAIDILTELLKEENIKEYISEITSNSNTQMISNKTSLSLTLIRSDIKNEFMTNKSNLEVFHYMVPDINDLDADTKLVIQAAEKGDVKCIEKVGKWLYKGKNNMHLDYEWSYSCYKKAAEKGSIRSLLKVAELNEEGIGTEMNYNAAYEYYNKALKAMEKNNPDRPIYERKKNELSEKIYTALLSKVSINTTTQSIERYFKPLKFKILNAEKSDKYQKITIQFESMSDIEKAKKIVKEKRRTHKYDFEVLCIKPMKSNRLDSLIKDLKKIDLDEFYPGEGKTEFESLGKGSYAETYKVYKRGTEEVFAAKVFTKQITNNQINSFKREIIMASKFDNHPSVVQYLGFNEYSLIDHYKGNKTTDIKPTILMKYVSCGNLEEAIIQDGGSRLTDTNKLKIIIGIASGLSEFYYKGIIHRDLKPENILINEKSEPVICDLGCSRQCSEEENYKMSAYIGSPIYMAPELYNDDFNPIYKYEVDSYSFGIILYQILTLKKDDEIYPNSNNPSKLMKAKFDKDFTPDLPEDMNDVFKYLITSCWNISFDNRPKPPMIYEILKEAILNNEQLLPNANLDEVKEYIKTLPNNKLEKIKKYIETLEASDIENIKEFFNKNATTNLDEFKGYIETISNENNEEFKKYVDALSNLDLDEIKEYIKTLPNDKIEKV